MIRSEYNPRITTESIISAQENKYFERKSARIKANDLAHTISGFANAEGGTIVIGISDKTREIEGLNECGEDHINALINAPKNCCCPMPDCRDEMLAVTNRHGQPDRVLLLHILPSTDRIIRTVNNSTFLRIGDQTREIKGDDLKNLEYSKNARQYEDELHADARIEDLDKDLLDEYKRHINAEGMADEQVLRARGFLREKNGEKRLTNAAVLLFARNIAQFYPNCRIRFVRYQGTTANLGSQMNIVKDQSIELPILRLIGKAKEFISSQLREFIALNPKTGTFQSVPEYPEFAWLEGIVNAVTHREYSMSGNYISVVMFDDRLEIQSPGRLPSLVTVENIRETRYSRNPRIARVLTDFGWVRELNEGVKRIYSDMEQFFLDEPQYTETEQSVKLVLKNNIVVRILRTHNTAIKNIGAMTWRELDDLSKTIVAFMSGRLTVTRQELEQYTGKSTPTIVKRLRGLIEMGIIKRNGARNDPKQTYQLLLEEPKKL